MTEQERVRWTRLVGDFEASDLTQREFATQRGISFSNLRSWIYKLRKESRPLAPESPKVPGQAVERAPAPEGSRLVPVRVVASAAKPRPRVVAVSGGEVVEVPRPPPEHCHERAPTGVAESVVMRMSGHRTRNVFDQYNIVEDENVRIVVKVIEAGIARDRAISAGSTLTRKDE
jgi:transposase-like protein